MEVIQSKYGGWRGLKEKRTNNNMVSLQEICYLHTDYYIQIQIRM